MGDGRRYEYTLRDGDVVVIGECRVKVDGVGQSKVRLALTAPPDVKIQRVTDEEADRPAGVPGGAGGGPAGGG